MRNVIVLVISLGVLFSGVFVLPAATPLVHPATSPSSGSALGASVPSSADPGPGDWPTYLENTAHTSANPFETTLSVSNAKSLSLSWAFASSGAISGSTTVVGTTAYFGTWSGYEYALDTSNGALLWKTYLGTTVTSACGTFGVASSATVDDGSLYIGGGNGYFYALDASTGAIEWSVFVGDPAQGYALWASPLLYEGFAYVGVASFCDNPLVPGGLLQVNLTTHTIQGEFHTTSNGELGDSVWGTPTVDPTTNTVYLATGNAKAGVAEAMADSIVAINATTLALVSMWQIPPAQQVADGDFGSTPTLFATSSGTRMVGALDKNGYFYAFRADDLASGPVWEEHLTTGQSVGSAAFANGLLYVGTGTATWDGTKSSGAAWALDAGTGAVVWERPLWGRSVSAPAYAHGLLAIDGGDHLFVLNAATGARLQYFSCTATFFAPPSISHARIFAGCMNGDEDAFSLPSTGGTPLSISSFSASVDPVAAGSSTTFTTVANGGAPPYSYAYTGLPPGCASSVGASFSCTPTGPGSYSVGVTVTDSAGATATASTGLTVESVYAVEFTESGLPTGTSWSVDLSGTTETSGTTSLAFSEPNGSYAFTVGPVPGEVGTPSSGTRVVAGAGSSRAVSFATGPPSIVSFGASPPTIALGGTTTLSTVVGGGIGPLTFAYMGLPAGCASANASELPCTPTGTGTFTVEVEVTDTAANAAFANATFTVTPTGVAVTFSETGLPGGVRWNVTLNGATLGSTTNTIVFHEPAGKYKWLAEPVPHHVAKTQDGVVTVGTLAVSVPVTYVFAYLVTFTESGLATGTPWGVTLRTVTLDSTTATLTFWTPNGTYAYSLVPVPGYTGVGSPSSVVVAHAATYLTVKFSPTAVASSPATNSGLEAAWATGARRADPEGPPS